MTPPYRIEVDCATLSVTVQVDGKLTEQEAWDMGLLLRAAALSLRETRRRLSQDFKLNQDDERDKRHTKHAPVMGPVRDEEGGLFDE